MEHRGIYFLCNKGLRLCTLFKSEQTFSEKFLFIYLYFKVSGFLFIVILLEHMYFLLVCIFHYLLGLMFANVKILVHNVKSAKFVFQNRK